jgi:hypothetical protein
LTFTRGTTPLHIWVGGGAAWGRNRGAVGGQRSSVGGTVAELLGGGAPGLCGGRRWGAAWRTAVARRGFVEGARWGFIERRDGASWGRWRRAASQRDGASWRGRGGASCNASLATRQLDPPGDAKHFPSSMTWLSSELPCEVAKQSTTRILCGHRWPLKIRTEPTCAKGHVAYLAIYG